MLPETEKIAAVKIAEKIRQAVAELLVPCAEEEIRVTISVGVVAFSEIHTMSFDSVIKLADDRLYRAKKMGRNRVCSDA